ncbi:DUF397 domain-containing protein [Streptomyces sp. NBC_00280]
MCRGRRLPHTIRIRDSTNPAEPRLTLSHATWSFLSGPPTPGTVPATYPPSS